MNIEAKSTYLCESPMIDYIYVYGFKKATGFIDNTINNKNYDTIFLVMNGPGTNNLDIDKINSSIILF